MPKIRNINPSDPGIQAIARRFTKEHPGVRLLDALNSLGEDEIRFHEFENEDITYTKVTGEKETTSTIELNLAVAYAQDRLRRKNNEWKVLNRLIKQHLPLKEREDVVRDTVTKIVDSLFKTNKRDDVNFLNYLIEQLKFISMDKKEAFDNREDNSAIRVCIIPDNLSSGENGFILNSIEAKEIIDLLNEAAKTPWHVNDVK